MVITSSLFGAESLTRSRALLVGIGGSEPRYFDPAELIEFAWRRQLEGEEPEDIYQSYVAAQIEVGPTML